MKTKPAILLAVPFSALILVLASCGSSSNSSTVGAATTKGASPVTAPAGASTTMIPGTSAVTGAATPAATAATGSTAVTTATTGGPGALTASEAQAAASGDVPDNQVFLVYHDPVGAFSMKYPEGWAQSAGAGGVVFRDHNNLVRVAVSSGAPPTVASVTSEMAKLQATDRSVAAHTPTTITLAGQSAIKVTYTTRGAPNPVTGKRVTLGVDRYYLAHGGRLAVVDLGTPAGVDNVDAYRLMIESFRWN